MRKDKDFNMQMNPSKFFHKLKCYGFTEEIIFFASHFKALQAIECEERNAYFKLAKGIIHEDFFINNFLELPTKYFQLHVLDI